MTPDEFALYSGRTRLQERALRMARAVLVDGRSKADAARAEGVTTESARQAVARVLREYVGEQGAPRDWTCLTVCVPPELAEEVRDIERRARRAAGLLVEY